MRAPLATRREPAGCPEQVVKYVMCFWKWNEK